jgi:hypothetical protein
LASLSTPPRGRIPYIDEITISEDQVCKLLKQIRPSASAGPDNIPPYIINKCATDICPSLTALYNKSIRSGTVPNEWKLANVIPVHKNGIRTDILNFLPISITSTICIVLERLVNTALLNLLQVNNLIPRHQHGFMLKRSGNSMLVYIINEWQKLLDTGTVGHIHALSIDWEKAFDMIPHSRLLTKL